MTYEDINHVNDRSDLNEMTEATIGEIYILLSFSAVKLLSVTVTLSFFLFFFFCKLAEVMWSEEYVATTIFSGYPGECLTLVHQICQRQNTFLSGKNSEKWKATKK